jgi:glycosyltransferase involved in cell wall biosynthesis
LLHLSRFTMIASCEQKRHEAIAERGAGPLPQPRNGRRLRLAILLSQPVQYFAPLFRELARRDELELTVIYCSSGGATPYFDPEFGLTVKWDTPMLDGYHHKIIRSLWPRKIQGLLAYVAPSILAEVRKVRFDVLLVFGWSSLTCWLAFAKASLESIPWMLYGDTNVLYEKEKHGLKRWLRNWLLHSLFRRTSAFLVSSSWNRRFYELSAVPFDKCFTVPLTSDKEFFSSAASSARAHRDEIRAQYGIPSGAVLLLFVGKLVAHKRPQDLLEVHCALLDEIPDLAVAFAGEGPERKALESEIAEKRLQSVFLLGFRNQSALPAIYAMSDIFILPSSREPVGVVVHEALACGLPTIVSDRSGTWGAEDVVRDGENGFVFPCGNISALTESVRKLASDCALRARMGGRSMEIMEHFSVERRVAGVLQAAEFAYGNRAMRTCPPVLLPSERL